MNMGTASYKGNKDIVSNHAKQREEFSVQVLTQPEEIPNFEEPTLATFHLTSNLVPYCNNRQRHNM